MKKYVPLIMLLCPLLSLSACSDNKSKQPVKAAPVPVRAGQVIERPVPVQIRAIGHVEAYTTVGIKSQIGGTLMHVHFKEGQDVSKGDLLFTIDPRPYEAALKQAEANLAKNTAQMENARVDADRYSELAKKGYVAQEQYDQVRTNAAALDATVNADRAAVDNAQLMLKYCYIYSPITGRTGSLNSYEGNLIKSQADTPMVVIHQIEPINVAFSVPEQYISEIKKHMATEKVRVRAVIGKDAAHPVDGVVTFVDNAVDTTTGTIRLKATFDNRDRVLWPGQFVTVQITLTTIRNAVVVPSQAVQTGQQGQFVFVIKEGSADIRPVRPGIAYEDITVIEQGLEPGEQIVTDGQMRLMPGAKVEIKK